MISILFLISWVLVGYGLTTILVYGSIFEQPRQWVVENSKFFGDLISCILCTSTWVGFFMSITLGGMTDDIFGINRVVAIFFDGMLTAGAVWALNSVIEFFEDFNKK